MILKESRRDILIRKVKEQREEAEKIAAEIGYADKNKSGMTIDAVLCVKHSGSPICELRKLIGYYGHEKFTNEINRVKAEMIKRGVLKWQKDKNL